MRILGSTDFAPTGNTDFLLDYFGLTVENLVHNAKEAIGRV